MINKAYRRVIFLTALALLLSSCLAIDLETGFDRSPVMQQQIIDQSEDRFADIDPLAINADVRQMVDAYIPANARDERKVELIQELLYDADHLHIQYSDERTHTAQEAFYAREGNCLSVMNLYVAIARYVGVHANFQTVRVQPSWDRRGDVLVLSEHINAAGRFGVQKRYVVDFTPEIALQQMTSAIITDQEARALYFNNLGVEQMIAGNLDEAIVYYKNALFLDPELSIAWNNIGATYRHQGNLEFAEYSYQMAFSTDSTNATAINNLAKFYHRQGDTQLAREYSRAIERFNNMNPYYHFAQGRVAYASDDLQTARLAFRRALRLSSNEPDFYLALAQVYKDMGYQEEAYELAVQAQDLLAHNAEIYQPSDQKLRIIDGSRIRNESSPGLTINLKP